MVILFCALSCLHSKLTLQNIYERKTAPARSENVAGRVYFVSDLITTSFIDRTYFLFDSVQALVKKNNDLLRQLVMVTAFKSTDFKFLRDQLKEVDQKMSDLKDLDKNMKSCKDTLEERQSKLQDRVSAMKSENERLKKTIEKSSKVISTLSAPKVPEDYFMDRKSKDAAKLNDDWLKGKITQDKYYELRNKLDQPKVREQYLREDLAEHRSIVSESKSVLELNLQEESQIPDKIKKIDIEKQWLLDQIEKIKECLLLLKNVRLELKTKIDSDID